MSQDQRPKDKYQWQIDEYREKQRTRYQESLEREIKDVARLLVTGSEGATVWDYHHLQTTYQNRYGREFRVPDSVIGGWLLWTLRVIPVLEVIQIANRPPQ